MIEHPLGRTTGAFHRALKKYPDAFEALHYFWNEGIAGDVQAPWQPLETAPLDPLRDPPLVMLWVDDGGHQGNGTHAFGRCYRSHDGRVRGVASGFSGNWSIRYWMPLPGGPRSSTGSNTP